MQPPAEILDRVPDNSKVKTLNVLMFDSQSIVFEFCLERLDCLLIMFDVLHRKCPAISKTA